MPTSFEWTVSVLLPLIVTAVAYNVLSDFDGSGVGGATHFRQWLVYMFLDCTYGHLFHMMLLVPARKIASLLPGSKVPLPNNEEGMSEQEEQTNDPSIVWPSRDDIAKLPDAWVVLREDNNGVVGSNKPGDSSDIINNDAPKTAIPHSSGKKKKRSTTKSKNKNSSSTSKSNANQDEIMQSTESNNGSSAEDTRPRPLRPYYLNHVRGSTRIRQASQRIAAAMGTLLSSYALCSISSLGVTMDDVGLGGMSPSSSPSSAERGRFVCYDLAVGFAVGSSIVVIVFALELWMGWISIVGYFDTVVPNEVFAINFAWDVLFHVGVSINEEVMLRGWMFILGCHGLLQGAPPEWFGDDTSRSATFAIAMAVVLQSTLFSLLHLYSPGSTTVSLLNLFLGGIAASLNVMVAGGTLWLGIGWHFGWNIFMGHILGRSTSGIPMSCAVVSVIPRPASPGKISYERYHGGTFGPEQGVLAPFAYILGMLMVVRVYGWDELNAWRETLVTDFSLAQNG